MGPVVGGRIDRDRVAQLHQGARQRNALPLAASLNEQFVNDYGDVHRARKRDILFIISHEVASMLSILKYRLIPSPRWMQSGMVLYGPRNNSDAPAARGN